MWPGMVDFRWPIGSLLGLAGDFHREVTFFRALGAFLRSSKMLPGIFGDGLGRLVKALQVLYLGNGSHF